MVVKQCRKCAVLLSNDNWVESSQRNRNYICETCKKTEAVVYARLRREQLKVKKGPPPPPVCRECKVELNGENWSPSDSGPRRAYICRECRRAYANKWSRENRSRVRYGISLEDKAAMLEAQGGKCAICCSPQPNTPSGVFNIDHCHITNAVRGLLCGPCNLGLGKFNDDVRTLRAAIAYLELHRGLTAHKAYNI